MQFTLHFINLRFVSITKELSRLPPAEFIDGVSDSFNMLEAQKNTR